MSTIDDPERREIAERLGRRADLYRNAGDQERARLAEDAAAQALSAPSLEDAGAIEASVGAPRRGFLGRLWDRLRRGGGDSDDS